MLLAMVVVCCHIETSPPWTMSAIQMMKLNSFNEIYVVSDKLVAVPATQFDRARIALDTDFPRGFEEFVLKFGKGDFSGYLRPYDPERIARDLQSNREWLSHDFWEDGALRLAREDRARLILFADTIDSDAFAFLPGNPEEIFVLPRHATKLFKIGPTFLDLLNWVLGSGELAQPSDLRFFQPWNEYSSLRFDNSTRAYELDEMATIFERVGTANHTVRGQDSIDYFIQKYGAHLNYLLLDSYDQFIVRFDQDSASEFVPLLQRALAGKGFRVTEHNRIATLPDLI